MQNFVKLFAVIFVVVFTSIQAKESEQKITALYMLSVPNDYIGQGELNVYHQDVDGFFKITPHSYLNGSEEIHVSFSNFNHKIKEYSAEKDFYRSIDWWIDFRSGINELLVPGIYKNAERAPFASEGHSGLSIHGCGRGCNRLCGDFEILELVYNENRQIESFAANGIQRCENTGAPLFFNIRINSNIPVENYFTAVAESSPVFFLVKTNSNADEKTNPLVITNENIFYKVDTILNEKSHKFNKTYSESKTTTIVGAKENWSFYFFSDDIDHIWWNYGKKTNLVVKTPLGDYLTTTKFRDHVQNNGDSKFVSIGFSIEDPNGEIFEGFLRFDKAIE